MVLPEATDAEADVEDCKWSCLRLQMQRQRLETADGVV
jgi:hypothetical protein